jgi:hypothetical protein
MSVIWAQPTSRTANAGMSSSMVMIGREARPRALAGGKGAGNMTESHGICQKKADIHQIIGFPYVFSAAAQRNTLFG